MSSEASSKQSCVHEGESYNEVYPSGQDNPNACYTEKVSFANSPSEKEDENLDVDGSESDISGDSNSEENIKNVESPIRSVVSPDGLRKSILPLMWMFNDFNSTIRRKHFVTLVERYQIPVNIPIRLPFKFEKCYYRGVDDVGVYKQMFKAGFKLPLNALHRRLL